MFGNVYGLDLGTYDVKVYDKKQNRIWKEKNAIAIKNKKEIFSIGDMAYEMFEKAPSQIEIVFPMKEGVISRFYDMQYLLQNLLKTERQFSRGDKYVIAVPTDVTEVEKKAFYDLVIHSNARAREVRIVERGIADAVGLDLDVKKSPGIFIVNMGGETTELSVLSYGGMVLNRLLKVGGATFDQAIVNHVRYTNDFLIGKLTAETLRKQFDIFDVASDTSFSVSGRNLVTGVPEQFDVSVNLVRSAMREHFAFCIREIRTMLERTPPVVQKSIHEQGIFLTGGIANLKGLDRYIEGSLGIPVNICKNPEFCAVNGLKKMIQSKELMKFTYSMLDDNYRWLK